MEKLLQQQQIIVQAIDKIEKNFKKDSASRKTSSYAQKRLQALRSLWDEFEVNHALLIKSEDQSNDYFANDTHSAVKAQYDQICAALQNCGKTEDAGLPSRSEELLGQQNTNFRALTRIVNKINTDKFSEKWEILDKLDTLQSRWKQIDDIHWQIDNLLVGLDVEYEEEFTKHEAMYESAKKYLNQKLTSSSHQHHQLPVIEIPIFSGNYVMWPSFMDLYCEAIHNNAHLTKAQKMQHLKGKLRGEAERLVQHLTVSVDNYDTCWEILTHRYNNEQLLFTKQIQVFLNQPVIQAQNAQELKRLHDTSLETIHAIHNLGVDTTTWDPILVHLLTLKLDPETYASYMESRKAPRKLPSFEELIGFLESKFTALEPIQKKKQPVSKPINAPVAKETPPKKDFFHQNRRNFPRTYHTSTDNNCPICKNSHHVSFCKTFEGTSAEDKMRTIAQADICQNCLNSHNGKKCPSKRTCRVCKETHHTILHDVVRNVKQQDSNKPSTSHQKANHVSGNFNEVLLATAQLKIKAMDGTYIKLRCLLDQGSQINLITESAAQRLGLRRRNQNATISGIGSSAHQSNGTVNLECESLYNDHSFSIEAMVMANMLSHLPNYSFEKQDWPHIRNINLADPDYNISRPVDILLDAGVYADIVMNGILRGPPQAPLAQQTRVGWVLLGNVKTFNCHVLLNIDDISRFWEMEEISEEKSQLTKGEDYCETMYAKTTRRLPDGRYEVRIPMKPGFEQHLGASKPQAIGQFKQLEKRLARDENLAASYKNFIDEYISLGHMKLCTEPRDPSCFLPHHGVMKLDSTTTKLRVVFNASSRTKSGYSLNQLMESGPNLQQDLQSMIIRWRTFQYVFTADIEKYFRQIMVQEEDQHLQKIVWRNSVEDLIKEYQLCSVTYGTKAASFLSMRTIKQLIMDEGSKYPLAANMLEHQLYVDDLLGGYNDLSQAKTAQQQLIDMLKSGGFNLRKWASNDSALLQSLPDDLISQKMLDFKDAETNKTLGLTWNPRTDQFTFKQVSLTTHDVTTKRTLLSDLAQLYDPLGWLAPITMRAKLIFQQAWTATTNWDDPLPDSLRQDWLSFPQERDLIHQITLPRWIGNTTESIDLCGFCDASERGYSSVIYCKLSDNKGDQPIQLVAAKTKLAPLRNPPTLPRLELCGALLLSRLMKKVLESINTKKVTIYGWTDSMIVLGWLNGEPSRWTTFVANRVIKITEVMPPGCWRHVRSEDNPADCASRGLNPSQLVNHHLWWGPGWLNNDELPSIEIIETNEERKKTTQVCAIQQTNQLIDDLVQKHSSITRVTRVVSWILRFIHNCRHRNNAHRTLHLTTSDLNYALNVIIRNMQNKHFYDDIEQLRKHKKVRSSSSILTLSPTLDESGLLRIGGRLGLTNLSHSRKHPVILPNNDKLTELLIEHAHITTLHGGARLTLSYLRNKFWILGGMRTVKKQLLRCVRCHRFKTQNNAQQMADLPKPRVTPSRPFSHVGVDFSGHVDLKVSQGRGIRTTKGYIAIFVCLCTKAVHLELVGNLSTACFLACLKRLCARRGTPSHIYSDNGTNFVGAARVLAKEREEALRTYVNTAMLDEIGGWGIEWHFNAPAWPSAGGLWEAAVRSMKHHLKRVLGEQKLTFEEFTTLLGQIEACLNSRPLVALSSDIEDLTCLTPGHFLVGGPVLAPPLTPDTETRSLTVRWQQTEKMYRDFWKMWSKDYLQSLQPRGKWFYPTKDMEVDDVVLIKEDNMPPARWLLGRVVETHPGADGRVRVVTVKTKTTYMKRPITKLSRLPIDNETPITSQQEVQAGSETKNAEKPSRQRRARATKRTFTSLLSTLLVLFTCLAPSTSQLVNVTQLNSQALAYFDKIADMQIAQDEWKVVVYYNISTYWQGLANIEKYVNYLSTLCNQETAFLTIITQLRHELNELRHYNDVLVTEHGKRSKRGLIDGIGYVANSLFGVLDQRFADQYDKDIQMIQTNERHLLNLYKQHTSIIEGEYNVLRRNEEVMNRQFSIIAKHLYDTDHGVRQVETQVYITATALAANMIVNNLRRVQQQLIDLVTDAREGRVDTHLLKPKEFEDQLNIISGQVPKGLTLPCTSSFTCIRQMYKLARVHTRLTDNFVIFEVKLPLISTEQYELTRVIPILNVKEGRMTNILPTSEYLAVSLSKDLVMPVTSEDISSCIHISQHQLICTLNLPIFDIKTTDSICEAQIINNRAISACRQVASDCRDDWIKLHSRGAWLFTCCKERLIRIFCPAGLTTQVLRNAGIITLADGCLLRGDHHLIHSHYKLQSEVKTTDDDMYIPESNINDLLTGSINQTLSFQPESHDEQLKTLKAKIELVKNQQEILTLNAHAADTHYTIIYPLISICCVLTTCYGAYKLIRRCRDHTQDESPTEPDLPMTPVQPRPVTREDATSGHSRTNDDTTTEISKTDRASP